jgi:hypothetical protein
MVEVYFFLINANRRPVYDSPKSVDVPDSLSMPQLCRKIQEHMSRANVVAIGYPEIWQYTGPEPDFFEGEMPALERKIKDAFNNKQVRKPVSRTKIRDLHIRDNESLLVEVSGMISACFTDQN